MKAWWVVGLVACFAGPSTWSTPWPRCAWWTPSASGLTVTCGPTRSMVTVGFIFGFGGRLQVTAGDEVDLQASTVDGFEVSWACAEVSACPSTGLVWTVQADCSMAGPGLDGTAPCDVIDLTRQAVADDPVCPEPPL